MAIGRRAFWLCEDVLNIDIWWSKQVQVTHSTKFRLTKSKTASLYEGSMRPKQRKHEKEMLSAKKKEVLKHTETHAIISEIPNVLS